MTDAEFFDFDLGGPISSSSASMFDLLDNDYWNLLGGYTGLDYLAPVSDLSFTPVEQSSWWDELVNGVSPAVSKVTDWLGGTDKQGNPNWMSAGKLGLGALGMYGNWQANKAAQELQKAQAQAALGRLDLDRSREKANQAEALSGRAMVSDILANKGHLAAGQSNPWLNYLHQAQQEGGFAPGNSDPFAGYSIGAPVSPLDNSQLLAGIESLGYKAGGAVRAKGKADSTSAPADDDLLQEYLKEMRAVLGGAFNLNDEVGIFNSMLADHMGSGRLVKGPGGGQDDLIDAKLGPDEYVIDADVVSALGDGSPEEGARKLDRMRERVREHKRAAPSSKIPPKAKDPLDYLGGK